MTLPSPQTTLAILLGAYEWPSCPTFQSSPAFANAAQGIKDYLLSPYLFGLPQENLLDLFNSPASVDEIDETISAFLEERIAAMKKARNAARDILLYFVGHGELVGRNADFFLAIRRTRSSNIKASSLQMDILADTLRNNARHLRYSIIIDCCFAGAAFKSFQTHPAEAAINKTIEAFQVNRKGKGTPKKGVSVLGSSNHKTVSQLLADGQSTMFSYALLKALSEGCPSQQNQLSLREVKELTEVILHDIPNAPWPVIHSPDQSEGDVADIPFFPNPGRQYMQQEQVPLPSEIPDVTEIIKTDWLTFVLGFLSEGKKTITLFDAGHMLLSGGRMGKTSQAKFICLQLCSKAPAHILQIAILDLASHAEEWKEFRRFRQVAVIISQKEAIEQQILTFHEELERRQKQLTSDDPNWLIILENFTALEPSKLDALLEVSHPVWQAFVDLLRHGKDVRMFVMATTRRFLASGNIHDLFHTKCLYAPDSDDDSVDALVARFTSLAIPEDRPIIYLRICHNSAATPPRCSACKKQPATHIFEDYTNADNQDSGLEIIDDEYDVRFWLKTVIEQVTEGPHLYRTIPICLDCTSTFLDVFLEREGVGESIIKEILQIPKHLHPLFSYVGFKQVGQPNIPIAYGITSQTIQEILQDIQGKGLIQRDKGSNCGKELKNCAMCKQPKCFNCTDEIAASLGICRPCLNEYNDSVQSYLEETIAHPEVANQKGWCDTCNDWMPHSHQHKARRRWL